MIDDRNAQLVANRLQSIGHLRKITCRQPPLVPPTFAFEARTSLYFTPAGSSSWILLRQNEVPSKSFDVAATA
jgi:hypothetical protein